MKNAKSLMKIKQKDLFDFKKISTQDSRKTDPTSSMATVTISSTQSITTIFM